MLKFPLPCVMLILSALPLGGCMTTPVAATRAAPPISWNGQDRIDLPLTLNSNGHPTVPVSIRGRNVVALLDTGSSVTIISPAFAAGIDMTVNDYGISSDQVAIEYGPVSQELVGIYVTNIPMGPDVLAGQNLFSQAVVEFDFDRNLVTLTRPSAFTPPTDEPISVQYVDDLPTIQIKVNGRDKPVCAIVDTGFNGGIFLSQKAVNELALPSISGSAMSSPGVGGAMREVRAMEPLKELRVGDQLYRNVSAAVGLGSGRGRCAMSALLGMEVLSKQKIIFDLGSRRMWLLPRSEIKSSR